MVKALRFVADFTARKVRPAPQSVAALSRAQYLPRRRGVRQNNCGLETAASAPVSAHGVQGERPCQVFIAGTPESDDNCIRREAGWRAIVGRRPVRRRRTRFGQRLLTRLLAMREVWACLTQRDALRSYPAGAGLSRRPDEQRAKGTAAEPRWLETEWSAQLVCVKQGELHG